MKWRLVGLPLVLLGGVVLAQEVSVVKDPVRVWPKGMPPSSTRAAGRLGSLQISVRFVEVL